MDLRDKRSKRLIDSFRYAISGICYTFKTERNFKIHIFATILVVLLASLFSVSRVEWLMLIIVIGMTLTLELVNTAVERVVNMLTTEYHPLAKIVKDVAAGAVFISSIISMIVGLCIFAPRLIELLTN